MPRTPLPSPRPDRPLRARSLRAPGAATLAAALVLTGCSSSDDSETEPTSTASSTSTASTPVEEPTSEPAEFPEGPAGEQAAWFLEQLDPATTVSADEITARVSEAVLAEMSAEDLAATLTALAATGPWTPRAVAGEGSAVSVTIVDTAGTYLEMQVATDEAGQVTTLFFAPGSNPDRAPAASWDELDSLLGDTGVDHSLQVSTVDEAGLCTPVHQAGETATPMPVGSIVKLYVLGAVVTAVADGTLTWDTELTLTDDLKSLPSGTLQDQPAGTTVTVQQAAAGMISISDNTATDLLISTVGRDAVVSAMGDMGHHDPALNTPLLTTRDLFWFGWGAPESVPSWTDLDVDAREALQDQVPAGVLDIDPMSVTTPRWDDGLDWFATAADLCSAHAGLQTMAGTEAGEPVRDILSANTGITLDEADWPYVAFKGGNAPGEIAGAWLAETADGETVVVSLQLATDDPLVLPAPVDLFSLAEDAFGLYGS